MTELEPGEIKKPTHLRGIVRGYTGILFIIALIFLIAGRISYWQGWVYGGFTLALLVISSIVFRADPSLLRERFKPGPGTKWWDKVFYAFYLPAFLAVLVIGVLDAGRYGWTGKMSLPVYITGCVLQGLSQLIIFRAMRENPFFSSTVRIQEDRGQTVIETGLYRYIRHPGYVGGILYTVSSPLVLGSFRGLIPAGFVVILLIIRTYLEDKTLQNELPGYREYAGKTRYRLLPGVW